MPSRMLSSTVRSEAARFRTDGGERVVVPQDFLVAVTIPAGEPCRRPGNRRRGRVVAAVDVGSWPEPDDPVPSN
jgi:hypothetical protein